MGQILIKGRTDAIKLDNETCRNIKDRWLGNLEKGIEKSDKNDILDLGDAWAGTYGQIKTVEIDPEHRKTSPQEEIKPLSEAQIQANRTKMKQMREDMEAKGILRKKN